VAPAKLGQPLRFGPPAEECDAAVIWLHGFDDGPDGWATLLRPFRRVASQRIAWLHLRAPLVEQPCYNGEEMLGWGPFLNSERVHVGSEDYENKDESSIGASFAQAVHVEIRKLVDQGLFAKRILLGGFSQGAAVALEAALCFECRLAGCIVLSAWATCRARDAMASKRPAVLPVLLCHGTDDDLVSYECGQTIVRELRSVCGDALQFKRLEGMGHASCREELRCVASFIQQTLGFVDGEHHLDIEVPEWANGQITAADSTLHVEREESRDSQVSYVSKRALDCLEELLRRNAEIRKEHIMALTNIDALPDDEILVPMSLDNCIADVGDDEGISDAIHAFGIQRVAEEFLEGARPKGQVIHTLRAADWRCPQASDSDESTEAEAWCTPKLCSSLYRQPRNIKSTISR